MADGEENGACGLKRDETIMVRKTGETGTDNLSRIQSVSSKHFEAMGGENGHGNGEMNGNGMVDPDDVDIEAGKEGKEMDGEGDGDEEDEIEEDPDKRNRLDGYYVAMGIILGLCILGTLSYMAVTNISHKEPQILMTTEGPSSTNPPKTTPVNGTLNVTTEVVTESTPGVVTLDEVVDGGDN